MKELRTSYLGCAYDIFFDKRLVALIIYFMLNLRIILKFELRFLKQFVSNNKVSALLENIFFFK